MKKLILTTSILIAFILNGAHAQTAISEAVKSNIKARIDNGDNVGIVIGIFDANGSQYYSYGVKSLVSKEPVNENSVFEIGSITKTFTAILLADMVIKGEVSLNDPLQNFLPEGIKAPSRNGTSIQLIHMANHTSSLPRMPDNFTPANPANPFADYSEKQMYEFLNGYALTRDVGSEFEYSNYAVGLLGYVLATKKGVGFEKLMIDVIAKPLKMNDTRIALTPNMKTNLAMGHSEGVEVENWDITTLAGAGAIRSSTKDMLIYLRANMGKVKSKLYPAMQLTHKNSRAEGSNPMLGLAWIISPELEILWHNGGTGGYRTFAGFTKDGGKGVVVLSNSNASVDDLGIHVLNSKSPLKEIKPSIGIKVRSIIDTQGIEAGVKAYWELKKDQAVQYDFSESQLNNLGKVYLRKGEIEKAIAVFGTNTEAYPQSSNVFLSRGEAFAKKGDKDKAIEDFKKSVMLNPGNQAAIDGLAKFGVDAKSVAAEIIVDTQTLESYVGQYQLAPGFILTVSREENQLKAQATGQPQFPVFPKSQNVFYLKVVEAQLTFNKNEAGQVQSVTLNQGGQEIVGKKL
jgi:serine-type D-Ala-D-Ala carboxypeptidase/endopeptidase